MTRRACFFLLVATSLYLLYFWRLDAYGILGPDEARYAAIGREMARSGDWLTPRLWGQPWFEKPPLLYWLVALGSMAGLPGELAARWACALLGFVFLFVLARWAQRYGSVETSLVATLFLGTSAGWLAYSHVGVMDMPLATTLGAAMLWGFQALEDQSRRHAIAAGVSLGLALLAKGAVALVLFLPLVWLGRRRWKPLFWLVSCASLIAAPWYLACTWVHGQAFLREFFWKHHVERFTSESLQHVQPFWFYAPILLAGLLPWPASLIALFRRELYRTPAARFLLAWFAWGFVFFSASRNKLPGYLLPLLPPVILLAAQGLQTHRRRVAVLAVAAALCGLAPLAAQILPEAVLVGLSDVHLRPSLLPAVLLGLLLGLAVGIMGRWRRPEWALLLAGLVSVAAYSYIKLAAFPALDRVASARALWQQIQDHPTSVCVAQLHRNLWYSLNYYAGQAVPPCDRGIYTWAIWQAADELPRLVRFSELPSR